MLFQIYGSTSATQLLGWVLVFVGLILLNELGRRTKWGGILVFMLIPAALTVYFIVGQIGLRVSPEKFSEHYCFKYMNGWFHYAKLYAATAGCIGFIMIKYKWGIGAKEWFKPWPFVIVAINILIAVVSDFESCVKGGITGGWWVSNEGVFLYGGWWNVLNGLAGILNIFCMTGWWGIYSSKRKNQDMLWPDMTWAFILAYDVWNFEYTYLNLPTHSWYCGIALLLAPTFAASFWNKGGWIQNRAFTLSIWCMFAQMVPFQLTKPFSVIPSLYKGAVTDGTAAQTLYDKAIELYNAGNINGEAVNQAIADMGITADPKMQGIIAVAALLVNVCVFAAIMKKSCATKTNPYKNEIWKGTRDFEEAMARAE
ncbi:MAG: DUF5692 family protein [Treponemataceae bacterium]